MAGATLVQQPTNNDLKERGTRLFDQNSVMRDLWNGKLKSVCRENSTLNFEYSCSVRIQPDFSVTELLVGNPSKSNFSKI